MGLDCHCGPAECPPCEGGSCGGYPDSDGTGGRIWTGY